MGFEALQKQINPPIEPNGTAVKGMSHP
jgi:hypothetical protein